MILMCYIAIVEDDSIFRKELGRILASIPGIQITGVFDGGEEFLSQVSKIKPDILFLDVGLPGISGIQVADYVRRDFPYMEIVFITGEENHIRDAFRLYASDYISKPLKKDRLLQTLGRIRSKFPVSEAKLELKCEEKVEILKQEDIYLVEALSKKTMVYTLDNLFTCIYSMKEMEARLDKDMFYRTSRSYLVNLRLVESVKSVSRTSYQILFKGRDYRAYLQKELYPEFRLRIKGLSFVKGEKG